MPRMCKHLVDTLADIGKFDGLKIGAHIAVEELPVLPLSDGAESAGGRYADDDAAFPKWLNGMYHHATTPFSPFGARRMICQGRDQFPACTVISAAEKNARIGAEPDEPGSRQRRERCTDSFERGFGQLVFGRKAGFGQLPGLAAIDTGVKMRAEQEVPAAA